MKFRDKDDEDASGYMPKDDTEAKLDRLKEIFCELEDLTLEAHEIVSKIPELDNEWAMNILQSLDRSDYGTLFADEPTMVDIIQTLEKRCGYVGNFGELDDKPPQTRSDILCAIGSDWC